MLLTLCGSRCIGVFMPDVTLEAILFVGIISFGII
jgi:hypothetical protein